MEEVDVAIIGGGVIGCACAAALAGRVDGAVTVLERDCVGAEATAASCGLVYSEGPSGRDLTLALKDRTLRMLQGLPAARLRQCGALEVCLTERHVAWARGRAAAAAAEGRSVHFVDGNRARALDPALGPAVKGALWYPLAACAPPQAVADALAAEARSRGARLQCGPQHEVVALRPGARTTLRAAGGAAYSARSVILAGGVWCSELAAMAGLHLPLFPIKGQMWATHPGFRPEAAPRTVIGCCESSMHYERQRREGAEPHSVTHLRPGGPRETRHVYGKRGEDGAVCFGGDRRVLAAVPRSGRHLTVEQEGITANREHVEEFLPGLRGGGTARSWAGVMSFTRDGEPVIGRCAAAPGGADVWVATGFASSGIMRGPAAGAMLAAELLRCRAGLPETADSRLLRPACPDRMVARL